MCVKKKKKKYRSFVAQTRQKGHDIIFKIFTLIYNKTIFFALESHFLGFNQQDIGHRDIK